MKQLMLIVLVGLFTAAAHADTLLLKDGRQYTGIVAKNSRGYTIFVGERQFSFTDDQVDRWIKGDAPLPDKKIVKPHTPGAHPAYVNKGPARTVQALTMRGRDALALGDFRVARNAYYDLLVLDPADPSAMEGLGAAYLKMNDPVRAKQYLEAAVSRGASTRPLAMNDALANLRTKNAARAAKILRDFLSDVQAEDTRALDLLQISVGAVEGPAAKSRAFEESKRFAAEYEAKLQSHHPGLQRWGSEWLSPDEVKRHQAEQKSNAAQVAEVEKQLAAQKSDVAKADSDMADLILKQRRGVNVSTAIAREDKEIDRLRGIVNATELHLAAMKNANVSASASGIALEVVLPGEEAHEIVTPPPVAVVTPKTERPSPPMIIHKPLPAPSVPPPEPTPAPTPAPEPTPPPRMTRSVVDNSAAFAVGPDLIVTDAQTVDSATNIRVQSGDNSPMDAVLLRKDEQSGLALLRVAGANLRYVILQPAFAGGNLQCVGYPEVDLFDPHASIIAGSSAAPSAGWVIQLQKHPRLPGAPLIDASGRVVGIELATRDAAASKIMAAAAKDIIALLGADAPKAVGNARAIDAIVQLTATHEK